MFFGSDFFWILMGASFVLVGFAFKAFAEERGWTAHLVEERAGVRVVRLILLSFYAWGTLAGENESSAGIKMFLVGIFVCAILGVGLWRLMSWTPKSAVKA